MNERIRCAVIGCGATFNFGWMHTRWIQAVPDLKLLAICTLAVFHVELSACGSGRPENWWRSRKEISGNMYQTGPTEQMVALEPLEDKWKSFGWSVRIIDGHNMTEIVAALESVPFERDRPSVIIANTIKGKGVSFLHHHHMAELNESQLQAALRELGEVVEAAKEAA